MTNTLCTEKLGFWTIMNKQGRNCNSREFHAFCSMSLNRLLNRMRWFFTGLLRTHKRLASCQICRLASAMGRPCSSTSRYSWAIGQKSSVDSSRAGDPATCCYRTALSHSHLPRLCRHGCILILLTSPLLRLAPMRALQLSIRKRPRWATWRSGRRPQAFPVGWREMLHT